MVGFKMNKKIQEQVLDGIKPDSLFFSNGQCSITQTSLKDKELTLNISDGEQISIYSKKDISKAIARTIELMEEDIEHDMKVVIDIERNKSKADFRNMIEESKCYCELCAFEGKCDGMNRLIKEKELLAKIGDDKEVGK